MPSLPTGALQGAVRNRSSRPSSADGLFLGDLDKARLRFEYISANLDHATERENNYSSKFVEIELQIASILLSVIGASALLEKIQPEILKVVIFGAGFLVVSLVFGLSAFHVLQKFWNERMETSRLVWDVWRGYLLEGGDYRQANADCRQITGNAGIVESPKWPYYLQTISLALGTALIAAPVVYLVFTVSLPVK